jgi:SET domain-containing protein
MTVKQLLKNLSQTYCRIGDSKIHGVGVIAIQDIPKGVNPFPGVHAVNYIGISQKELKMLDKVIQKMIIDFFVWEDGKIYIPECGLNGMDISFFMNHTDTPNVGVKDGDSFITLRKVKKGEELAYNYTHSYGKENTLLSIGKKGSK